MTHICINKINNLKILRIVYGEDTICLLQSITLNHSVVENLLFEHLKICSDFIILNWVAAMMIKYDSKQQK